jgi:glycosyltransferase 2 family protein
VRRPLFIAIQLAVSGGLLAYLLWLVDLERTGELIVASDPAWVLASLAIFVVTTWGLSWRWQILLASKGILEPLGWLTKLYFVSYAVGQVLPTSVGGDAVRIVDHARRRPEARGEVAAAVVIDRVVGAAATLVLVAVGLAVAVGRYGDIGLYIWVELASVAALALSVALLFSRRAGDKLMERVFPLGRRVRLERPLRTLYLAMHGYRHRPRTLAIALVATIVVQLPRFVAIWMCGKAVGVDLSPVPYLVLGPLLVLVSMVPFTINGLGVREAFFVAFLARFDVSYDAAFATGLLYYVVTVLTSLPGGFILLWRSLRPAPAA